MNSMKEQVVKRAWVAIPVTAFLFLAHLAITDTFLDAGATNEALDRARLDNERMLGERLQLEKEKMEMTGMYQREARERADAEGRVEAMRRRVEAAVAHSRDLEGTARRSRKLARELEELQAEHGKLGAQLAASNSLASDMQQRMNALQAERDGLAAELAEHRAGAHMVNNAEVAALRGKKAKLTVVARKAREIRMAFDLPDALAGAANFKIVSPNGKKYEGGDPELSWTVDAVEAVALASLDEAVVLPGGEAPRRVHLRFAPSAKLEPGTYRIDVLSGGSYMNTVLLNLR